MHSAANISEHARVYCMGRGHFRLRVHAYCSAHVQHGAQYVSIYMHAVGGWGQPGRVPGATHPTSLTHADGGASAAPALVL